VVSWAKVGFKPALIAILVNRCRSGKTNSTGQLRFIEGVELLVDNFELRLPGFNESKDLGQLSAGGSANHTFAVLQRGKGASSEMNASGKMKCP